MSWSLIVAAWLLDPAAVHCTVELEGVPVSLLRAHRFVTQDGSVVAAHRVSFAIRGPQWLRLVGPRYRGLWRMSVEACRGGLMKVKARPRAARVQFRCAPKQVVVRCTGCSDKVDGQWHLAESFPGFRPRGLHHEVEFELKAAGFRPTVVRTVIHPGHNEINAHLKPRE